MVEPTLDGEVELDFDAVTMEALIRVDTYIRHQKGLPPREYPSAKHGAEAAAPASPQSAATAAPRPPLRPATAVTGRRRGAGVIDDVSCCGWDGHGRVGALGGGYGSWGG